MYYVLNNNVYLIEGKSNSCIYDFNTSKLFRINKALSDVISMANRGEVLGESIEGELRTVLNKFIELGILVLSECPSTHNITEIASTENKFSFAWIEVTQKCNLKCHHCYNESSAQCQAIMSYEHFQIIIDTLENLGLKRIQIIGGEPFVDKKALKKMLLYACGKFNFIEIFTNGTLIDSEWLDILKQNNIHVALSVYSYDKTMHDKVTGQVGSWDKTHKTIASLKERGIPYRVCNVLMKGINLGTQTSDLYTLSSEKDVVRMSGRASFALLSDDLIRKKLITKKTFETPLNKDFSSRLLSGHNCFRDRLYISANMEVFPCVMERRFSHGKIDKNSGISINNSIRQLNKDKIDGCCNCEYRYACFDCRPDTLSNNLLEKPWYCTYNPLNGEWADIDTFIRNLKQQYGDYNEKSK